jgi:hypothetical protein
LRFRSQPLVALSIILILAGASGAWHQPDDRDGEPARVVHQPGHHNERIGGAKPAIAPEHCALCHWLRAFGSKAPAATALVTPIIVGRLLSSTIAEIVHSTDRLVHSSRGPPLA